MFILVLVGLGLCFGSFVNALVWRVHKQENAINRAFKAKYSISKGRSMCVHCQHELAAQDLVPVLSWVWLRGQCRYCHKAISWQYPLVELLTVALFVISYVYWPVSIAGFQLIAFCVWLVMLVGFMALAVYDLRWFILPNRIVYPLLALAIAQQVVGLLLYGQGLSFALAIVEGMLVGGGLFAAIFFVSKGKWIGFGDVRLGALLGIILASPAMALLMIFISSVLGTFVSVPLLLSGRAKQTTKLPYGPFLIVGSIIVRLFGLTIINWYKHQLGLA